MGGRGIAALAALLTLLVPARAAAHDQSETPADGLRSSAGAMLHGLRLIARTPLLRAVVLLLLALAVVLAAFQGMVIPVHFAFRGEGQPVGFVLSALAAGMLVGRGLFAAAGARLPVGPG